MNTPIRTFLVMSFAIFVGYGLIALPFVATRIAVPVFPSLCDYGWTRFVASKECFFVDVNKVYFHIPTIKNNNVLSSTMLSNDDLWVSHGSWEGNTCMIVAEKGKPICE